MHAVPVVRDPFAEDSAPEEMIEVPCFCQNTRCDPSLVRREAVYDRAKSLTLNPFRALEVPPEDSIDTLPALPHHI